MRIPRIPTLKRPSRANLSRGCLNIEHLLRGFLTEPLVKFGLLWEKISRECRIYHMVATAGLLRESLVRPVETFGWWRRLWALNVNQRHKIIFFLIKVTNHLFYRSQVPRQAQLQPQEQIP